MMLSRRKLSAEFKLRAVRQVEVGASVADNYNGWVLPPLVICAVGAHKEILVKTESKAIRWLRWRVS